ncbi:MAG: glycosyltransferase family 2 protein [Planctomycetes bacterium]|nr:glycosyltransferase family 2 protein [Planctomycetota bacterium]
MSLVLTARNAGAVVLEVVEAWLQFLKIRNQPFEIVLVDDGSSDDTKGLLELLAQEQPALRFLRHDDWRGPGAALATGIAAAQHPLLCYATCDKQFQPADLQRFLEHIDQVDLVTGYRVAVPTPGWLIAAGWLRHWLARILLGDFPPGRASWLGWTGWRRRFQARWIFGLRVQDPECPFRLFRREVFRRIPIQSRGSLVHIEILAKANHFGCMMAEAPVSWLPPKTAMPEPVGLTPRSELSTLFHRPDFGPPRLEEPAKETATTVQGESCQAT